MPLPSFNQQQNTTTSAPLPTQQQPTVLKQQAVFIAPNNVLTTSTTATHSLHDEFNATYQACLAKFDNWATTKKNEINSLRSVHRKQIADIKGLFKTKKEELNLNTNRKTSHSSATATFISRERSSDYRM